MTTPDYIQHLNTKYQSGISTEHSYRGYLQSLLEALCPDLVVTNEPTRVECGAPDYILTRKKVPVGYIEAKDIGEPLDGKKKHKEQFDRYKASLPNLLFTDYLDFHFYVDGKQVASVPIAEVQNGKIKPLPDNFQTFEGLITNFGQEVKQTVSSPEKLAEMMAGKARILADVLEKALTSDDKTEANTALREQMSAFRAILIHDINAKQFADLYAQTIAYGMFTARLHDPNLDTFTRHETAVLIPKTNPFLRKLFQYIAGYDLDARIAWIVDELADLFRATDIRKLIRRFGEGADKQDPFLYFYETFLAEYDPGLRKSRGVWYTPQPVVNFIVRAVDDILKTEFDLPQGLADTAKTKIKVQVPTHDKRHKRGVKEHEETVHKVQILDPATGTGTFLAEVVRQIHRRFEGQQGIWSNYVENHLIPRLNGFELLMASYAMAHLKLDLLLSETGFKPKKGRRLRVYLTNSLEEHHKDTGSLFANWLSAEANEANHIKRDTPIMCVIGNPPYSGESSNSGEWIDSLVDVYKKDQNGHKIPDTKWLNNDYVKFLRYGQYFIEKNGSGVLAFITDNSFLDSISFRGMRWSLLKTYDKIYTFNLHGNSKKKETAPDGSADQNVFDIMQGVSINIFVKTGKKKANDLSKAFYFDLYGKRELKYNFLSDNSLKTTLWNELTPTEPYFFLVPKDFSSQKKYDTFLKIDELLNVRGVGICSKRDVTAIKFSKKEILQVLNDFKNLSDTEIKLKYKTERTESRDKKLTYAKENIQRFGIDDNYLQRISYRPFDIKWTYFTNKSRGFLAYPVYEIMQHFAKSNYGLVVSKKSRQLSLGYMFITNLITDLHILDSAADSTYIFPLYLYPETKVQQTIEGNQARTPNLNKEIVNAIAESLGLTFTPEKEQGKKSFAPIDLLDYIYAALHSPAYREKYKEFLKIDFPRVPYPKDQKKFWQLVKLGGELRKIHLLEHPSVEKFITRYPGDGSNVIERKLTKSSPGFEMTDEKRQRGRVWINDQQYFDRVPLVAWEFYIGGYQPAQKWLKDRKGRTLSFEDIQHYQKIIVALTETDRLMGEVDGVGVE